MACNEMRTWTSEQAQWWRQEERERATNERMDESITLSTHTRAHREANCRAVLASGRPLDMLRQLRSADVIQGNDVRRRLPRTSSRIPGWQR